MPLSPIFSGWLPGATPGPVKEIGYAYFRSNPLIPYTIPSPRLSTTGDPALKVEEAGYALFYPCDPATGSGKSTTWFPEPVGEMVRGYERFLGKKGFNWLFQGLRLIIGRLKIPCYPNASLAPKDSKYPLIIFSHGLAGTRHTYTQYCSALASRGYVVLALEHRDGSAPAVLLPSKPASIGSDESGKSQKKKEPKQRVLSYTKKDEIEWQGGEAGTLEKFRTLQLEMRVREVYEAYHSFSRWVKGDPSGFNIEHSEKVIMGDFKSSFENKVDFEKIDLIGHSFGAGTVLHLLGQPVPDSAYSTLPVQRAIALDPWVEPIPKPTESTPSPSQDQPPVLIINSPGFTVWDSHFHRLLDMTKRINGSLVTVIGINHQSFSDFPLLSPSSPSAALGYLHTIHDLSSSFLEGELAENNTIKNLQPDGGDFARGSDGKMDGVNGIVVLHLLGKQTQHKISPVNAS